MALLPLRNALSFLDSAPAAMNFRELPGNPSADPPVPPNPLWDSNTQYFKNDCVVSGVNGGMYIFAGGNAVHRTTIKGGVDPADDAFADANWLSFAPEGLKDVVSTAATATIAQTALAPAVVSAGTLSLGSDVATPGATYIVNWQGTWTNAASNYAATDKLVWTFAPDGTGAVTVGGSVAPGVVSSPYLMAGSAVVSIPASGTQIVGNLSVGSAALSNAATLSGLIVTYSRII